MKPSVYNVPIEIGGRKLIFNTLTRSLLKVTTAIEDVLCGKADDADEQEVLKQNGLIVEDSFDEVAYVENQCFKNRFSSSSYFLVINPTLDCNLACWYCYEKHKPMERMSDNTIRAVINHIERAWKQTHFSILNVSFFGGEPLLQFDVVKSLMTSIDQLAASAVFKVKYILTTNATLITPSIAEFLAPRNVAFQITFDGAKFRHDTIRKFKVEGNGSFDAIIASLRCLTASSDQFRFNIRVNYDAQTLYNADQIAEAISFLRKGNVTISLRKVWQVDQSVISPEVILNAVKAFNSRGFVVDLFSSTGNFEGCYADKFYEAVINYDGSVFKCTARDFSESEIVGKLSDVGNIVWNVDKIQNRLSFQIPNICHSCVLSPLCSGFCSQTLLETKGKDLLCPHQQLFSVDDIIKFFIKQRLIYQRNA